MGRSPCCDEVGVKKGPWTPEEDKLLVDYIQEHGHGSWRNLPKSAGLNRCGKSCRLRWANYLRPDIKRGKFTEEEERLIIHLHSILGNKWSAIATRLSGRTDNEIKNYWNTHLKKKLLLMGIDPVTHRRHTDLDILTSLPSLLVAANLGNTTMPWSNALGLQANVADLTKFQILQSLMQILSPNSATSSVDVLSLLGSSAAALGLGSNNQFVDAFQMNRQLEAVLNGSLGLGHGSNPTQNSSLPNLSHPELLGSLQAYSGKEVATDQMNNFYSSILATANSTPTLVPASPDIVSKDQMQEQFNSNDASGNNSSTSTPFEAWEGLNTDDDDLCWKDILDQISWSKGQ